MKENNVTIAIKTLQRRAEGTESLRQRAEGLLLREEDGWRLSYREGEQNGLGSTRTTLLLSGTRAELKREGEVSSHMVFQVGTPHRSMYETPYGALPMTVRTLGLEWELSGAGGSVFIIYKIELGGAEIGENQLRLTVREKEKQV